jgi:hypothetical protein
LRRSAEAPLRQAAWTRDEHFTADGTLIELWASLKSFVRKEGADAEKIQAAKDEDPGNALESGAALEFTL